MEPVFESQTKTKLGSTEMGEGMPTVRAYINEFIGKQLDNFLHKNGQHSELLQKKILQAEKERKELSGIRKLARERAKKASIHNKKLRDCRIHLDDIKKDRRLESTLIITEGDSAKAMAMAMQSLILKGRGGNGKGKGNAKSRLEGKGWRWQ